METEVREIHVKDIPVRTWRRFKARANLSGCTVPEQLTGVLDAWLAIQDKKEALLRDAAARGEGVE